MGSALDCTVTKSRASLFYIPTGLRSGYRCHSDTVTIGKHGSSPKTTAHMDTIPPFLLNHHADGSFHRIATDALLFGYQARDGMHASRIKKLRGVITWSTRRMAVRISN